MAFKAKRGRAKEKHELNNGGLSQRQASETSSELS